ncbi:MAG: ABC transporter permease [Candidatus Zixiibacteriota bacterium]
MRIADHRSRVLEIVRKEFIQVRRDPRLLRLVLVAPMIQLIVFGYAVSTDVRHTKTFVVDHDRTQASRSLVEALTGSDYFDVVGTSDRPADLVRALDHADVIMGMEIPRGFAADLASGTGASVQLLFDGTNSNVAGIARGYAEQIVQGFGVNTLSTPISPPVELRERAWYNPDLASRNYNVPGVIGTVTLLMCLLLTSLAVVREREMGTLEQLMVSPLSPGELIAGKTIPFGLIGLLDLVLVTSVALLWFGIPLQGSLFLLFGASVFFLMSALGIGLLISTLSSTQQEAFMLTFLILMPMLLLAGFMFPVSSMPEFFQWATLLIPLRHFLEIIRGIFLKGAGLESLWPQFLSLVVMGVGVLAFAASRFSKRMA